MLRQSIPAMALFITLLSLSPRSLVHAQQTEAIDDKDVTVLSFEDLKYPHVAQTAHIQGVVVLRVKLDPRGNVEEVVPISGNPILRLASVQNAKKWHFESNPRGAAVLVYDFRIDGVCGRDDVSQMIYRPPNMASITACGPTVETR